MTANSNAYIDFFDTVQAGRRGQFLGDTKDVAAGTAVIAMAAGVACVQGSTVGSFTQPTTAAMVSLLEGVSIYNDVHAPTPDDSGNVEYGANEVVEVARKGRAWVYVEND